MKKKRTQAKTFAPLPAKLLEKLMRDGERAAAELERAIRHQFVPTAEDLNTMLD